MVATISYAQEIKSPPVLCEDFEFFDRNKNYLLEVEFCNLPSPFQYKDNEKVPVCSVINTIRLIKKDNGVVPEIKWKNAKPTSDRLVATTDATNFDNGKCKIEVEIEGEKDMDLTLRIITKSEIVRKNSIQNYEFDVTKSSHSNAVKFLEQNETDIISVKTSPSSKHSSNHIFLESTIPELTISNITNNSNNVEFELSSSINTGTVNLPVIKSCNKVLHSVMSVPKKTYPLEIYHLVETDDDFPNYCHDKDDDGESYEDNDFDYALLPNCTDPITQSDHHCINPGPDGSFDLGLRLANYPTFDDSLDDIITLYKDDPMLSGSQVKDNQESIVAGEDLECSVRPYRSGSGIFKFDDIDIADGNSLTEAEVLDRVTNYVNLFYQKFGIELTPNWNVIQGNFDLIEDDNILEYRTGLTTAPRKELLTFLRLRWGTTPTSDVLVRQTNPHMFLIKNIVGTAGGVAATGTNGFFVKDGISNLRWDVVVAHEIGHASWGLDHHPRKDNYMHKSIELDDDPAKLETKTSNYIQWYHIHN